MALKRKVTKDEFDKLPKELQGEYEERDGEYFLTVEGEEDPDALRRARDREKEEAKKLKKELKEAKEKLSVLEGDDDRKKGDIEKIDSAWKTKFEKLEAERKAEREASQARISRQMIDTTAAAMAAEISTKPTLMRREIADRLRVEFDDDGEPELVVIGKDGKPGSSLEHLRKEILANKEFADILIASKGSGGGATQHPTSPSGGAGGIQPTVEVDLARADPKVLMDRIRARKGTS